MKTLKFLFLTGCFFVTSTFAAEKELIYSCGFENDEDLSVWDLQTAAMYSQIDFASAYTDVFFMGTATKYGGSKSLYVSNDGGATNKMTSVALQVNQVSLVDLQITLEPGIYTLEFMYKMRTPQNIIIYALADRTDFSNFITIPPNFEPIAKPDDWTFKSINFTITESTNWLSFQYDCVTRNGGEEVDGFAIDNITIRKENTTSALSQTLTNSFTVTVQNHNIIVGNTTELVQVYNIGGQCVAQGAGAGSYSVPTAGVYVVRIGSEVRKIIVPSF